MKKLLLCMLFVVGCMAAQAQDVLVLRAGYEVEVQVQSTTETDIVYVPWDEPDGMSYSIPKTDVLSIRYADGRTEVLSTLGEGGRDAANQKSLEEQKKEAEEAQRLLEEQKAKEAAEKARLEQEEKARLAREKAEAEEKARLEKERAEQAEKARQEKQKKREEIQANTDFNSVLFQSYVYIGADLMSYSEGGVHMSYDFDASFGVRIKKYVYAGVEAGYHFMPNAVQYDVRNTNLSTHFWYVPIGVNVKGYIPTGIKAIEKRIYPYMNATIGGYLGTGVLGDKVDLGSLNMVSLEGTTPEWKNMSAGFYCQVGAGLDMNWGSIGVGYTCLLGNMNANQAYIKLGVRLGKTTSKQQITEE